MLLPGAYRSLPRPSSPTSAKASTVCPYLLDHIIKSAIDNIDNKRVLSLDRILLLDYYCIVKLMRLLIWLNRFQRSDFFCSRKACLSATKCGGERIRTDDPLRARQMLSQLSYTPNDIFISIGPEWSRTTDLTIISRTL